MRLARLKRKKVKAGHYIYAGLHIVHKRWYPRGAGGKSYMVWVIKELEHFKWTKRRFFRLEQTTKHIDFLRNTLYETCLSLERERKS